MAVITIAAKPAPATVDITEHVDALLARTEPIARLLKDMAACRASLLQMPGDAPLRRVYEQGWESLAIQMHETLRGAYRHLALICTVNPPLGWQTWEAAVGPHAMWQQVGLTRLLRYWGEREAPAYQWLDADWYALKKASIPPDFNPDLILTRQSDAV